MSFFPLLSVVIPVYNCEKYIEELLLSVENQTYKNLEIICINDGSTDTTLNILSKHQSKDSRIKIINQSNLGAGAARNQGLRAASGDYLSILDADDILDKNMFKEMIHSALTYDSDIVICKSIGFSDKKKSINIDYSLNKSFISGQKDVFGITDIKSRAFNFCIGWTWDKIFKRSFIEEKKIKFQELRRADDLFFTFFSIANANTISIVDKYLIHHRYHNEQMSQHREKAIQDFYYAIKKLHNELIKSNLYDTLQESFIYWLSRYCVWQYDSFQDRNKKLVRGILRNKVFKDIKILSANNEKYCDPQCLACLKDILWDYSLDKPLISVIVSGYNIEKYIESSIKSVISQTYENLEIILIDDGSTDNTKKIMEEYAARDSRIKLFSFKENSIGGVATAANFGIDHSTGDFIVFCDGDDWLSLTAIEDFLREMIKTGADFVYSKNTRFNEVKKKYLTHYDDAYWPQLIQANTLEKKKKILCLMGTEPWKKMYSRHFLNSHSLRFPVGDFFYEDSPFHFLCVLSASKITLLDKTTYYYRINRKGATTNRKNNETLKVFIHMRYIRRWITENNLFDIYKITLLKKALRSMDFIIGGLNIKGFYSFYKQAGEFFSYFSAKEIRNQYKEITNIRVIPLALSARAKRLWLFTILYFIKKGL